VCVCVCVCGVDVGGDGAFWFFVLVLVLVAVAVALGVILHSLFFVLDWFTLLLFWKRNEKCGVAVNISFVRNCL